MQPIIWRPPVRVATTDKDPVALGSGFGWVSGSMLNLQGSCAQGSGATFGPPVLDTNGGIVSVPVTAGGSGYVASSDFGLVVTGAGTWAHLVARANGSGVVTAVIVEVGGSGYTSSTTVTQAPYAMYTSLFDLGPDHDQYTSIQIISPAIGQFQFLGINGTPDGITIGGYLTYWSNIGTSAAAVYSGVSQGVTNLSLRHCGMRYLMARYVPTQDMWPARGCALSVVMSP